MQLAVVIYLRDENRHRHAAIVPARDEEDAHRLASTIENSDTDRAAEVVVSVRDWRGRIVHVNIGELNYAASQVRPTAKVRAI